MNTSAVKAIFVNTIQRELRNKTVLTLSILTLLALIGTFQFLSGMMSGFIDEGQNIDETISLFSPNLNTFRVFLSLLATWTSLIAIMLGANLIRSDEDEMVLHQLLALPIRRSNYLLARVMGACTMTLGLYLTAGLVIIFYLGLKSGTLFGVPILLTTLWPMFLMIIGLLLISSFYSLFLPKIVTLVLSLMTMIFISQATNPYYDKNFFSVFMGEGVWIKLQGLFFALLPPVAAIGRNNSAILNDELSLSVLLITSAHAFLGFIISFLVLNWFFKRRDF
jgi:ABC-type transport system involved in multi-copper enzyme maturation permease subunit